MKKQLELCSWEQILEKKLNSNKSFCRIGEIFKINKRSEIMRQDIKFDYAICKGKWKRSWIVYEFEFFDLRDKFRKSKDSHLWSYIFVRQLTRDQLDAMEKKNGLIRLSEIEQAKLLLLGIK